jgi:hypothetical protein
MMGRCLTAEPSLGQIVPVAQRSSRLNLSDTPEADRPEQRPSIGIRHAETGGLKYQWNHS